MHEIERQKCRLLIFRELSIFILFWFKLRNLMLIKMRRTILAYGDRGALEIENNEPNSVSASTHIDSKTVPFAFQANDYLYHHMIFQCPLILPTCIQFEVQLMESVAPQIDDISHCHFPSDEQLLRQQHGLTKAVSRTDLLTRTISHQLPTNDRNRHWLMTPRGGEGQVWCCTGSIEMLPA